MTGVELIATERARQLAPAPAGEGWTAEHDDQHDNYELARAACCYGQMGMGGPYTNPTPGHPPPAWPFDAAWWKPSEDPITNLVKAGALIAAEIDRLLRIKEGLT